MANSNYVGFDSLNEKIIIFKRTIENAFFYSTDYNEKCRKVMAVSWGSFIDPFVTLVYFREILILKREKVKNKFYPRANI